MRHAVRKPAAATILAVRESRPSGRFSCVWAARGVKHLQAGNRNAGDQRARSPAFAALNPQAVPPSFDRHQKSPCAAHARAFSILFKKSGGLETHHVACLELAVLAGGHIEGHSLALIEGLEAVHLDLREMHEQVFAVVLRDEAIALLGVKPLNSTFRILNPLFSPALSHGGNTARCMAATLALTSRARVLSYAIGRENPAGI